MELKDFRKTLKTLGGYTVKTKTISFQDLARANARFADVYTPDGDLLMGVASAEFREKHKAAINFVASASPVHDKGVKVILPK